MPGVSKDPINIFIIIVGDVFAPTTITSKAN